MRVILSNNFNYAYGPLETVHQGTDITRALLFSPHYTFRHYLTLFLYIINSAPYLQRNKTVLNPPRLIHFFDNFTYNVQPILNE